MSAKNKTTRIMHRTRTPRAAAIAGILFGVLFSLCIVLIQIAVPANTREMNAWTEADRRTISLAMELMPFAGLSFLWFMGVVRDRLGAFEDQFFSEVFQGSGLLFLGMTFSAFAIGSGMLAAYYIGGNEVMTVNLYLFGWSVMGQMFKTYALKMAAVFMFSLSTLWLQTGVMPRWLCFFTYAMAILMFVSISISLWMILFFPAWVFCISTYVLILSLRQKPSGGTDGMTPKLDVN
jgi:hypothetical protein